MLTFNPHCHRLSVCIKHTGVSSHDTFEFIQIEDGDFSRLAPFEGGPGARLTFSHGDISSYLRETLWEMTPMVDDSRGPLPDFRYEKITDIKKIEAV